MIIDALAKLAPGVPFSVNGGSYDGIVWPDGEPMFTEDEVNAEIPGARLSSSQSAMRASLRESCAKTITSLFQSSALGSEHSYDCRPEDQSNLRTRITAALADGLSRKVWGHDGVEFTRKAHTSSELVQVCVDMEAHIETQQAKLEGLIAAVNAAADEAAVDAVVW